MVIKGKRKTLPPDQMLDSILEANAGLPAWRVKVKRPRRRVTIAWPGNKNDEGEGVWPVVEWQQRTRFNREYHRLERYNFVTYTQVNKKPRSSFVADGKVYEILPPHSEQIKRASYDLEKAKEKPDTNSYTPRDIARAFELVWGATIPPELIFQAYKRWEQENTPPEPPAEPD